MKKIALLIATIALTTGLVGCTNNGTARNNKNTGGEIAQNQTKNGIANNATNNNGIKESGVLGINDTNSNNNTLFGMDLTNNNYSNGIYRGSYIDEDELTVEFTLANNQIKDIKFIALSNNDDNYLKDSNFKNVKNHYEALINYLKDKDIRQSLNDLYNPSSIVKDMDQKVEVGKVTSAIHDALNRGVYSTTNGTNK
ncbi:MULTISPECIES: hypothetical protein [unclassified Clostridium]|uniref:hypothetical protein n=1 Tax=unclassified Clostridium TaxID=2614128 RepID=UPI000E852136|nr:hypothetical protein [Clostridium sp.]